MFGFGELAAMASFDPLAEECRQPLARLSASLVRLLDRAMWAHADATGYAVAPWREKVTLWADMSARELEVANAEENPLPDTLRRVATGLANALVVVPSHVVHPGLLGGWAVSKPPALRRRTPDEGSR